MAENIQPGVLAQLKSQSREAEGVALQVVELEPAGNDKYKVRLTDGKETVAGLLASQVGKLVAEGQLAKFGIIRVTGCTTNMMESGLRLIVTGAEVLGAHDGAVGGAEAAAAVKKEEPRDADMQDAPAPAPQEAATAKTPAVKQQQQGGGSGGEARTPGAGLNTPAAHPTPPSAGWATKIATASAGKRAIQPIAALNPYNNNWTIKARLASKGQKRSFNKGGMPQSVFSAEFVDEQGTSIEGTFWRDAADRYYDALQEGKVYLLSKGQVKPANKKYSNVRNDYTLNFDSAAAVEECTDEVDMSKMQARMEFVPIDHLAKYADKKMTVDVIGVVTSAAPLGSVKRKTDNQELSRRDITIVDQSLKTVVVTLWGSMAEDKGAEIEAAAGDNPVLAISACRVSSFNGVSLSTLQRSQVLLNPDLPEAATLREWYESEGRGAATTHVGEGLESALKRGAQGQGGAQRATVADVKEQAPSTADQKPTYSTAVASFANIDTKNLWYMACPENNRKVTPAEDGSGYYCEYDGRTYPSMTRRYILGARVADESGELWVQVFNDQAEVLLGMKADELSEVKERNEGRFAALMRARAWGDFLLRVRAQAQEYNGEQRVRYSVADIKPLDYASESRRLLGLIQTA